MEPTSTLFKSQAEIFYALSHPSRLEILDLLRVGECCVCHIQAMLDQRQAFISQHLTILRQAGLIASRKEGQRVYYKVQDPGVYEVIDRAEGLLPGLGIHPAQSAAIVRQKKPCNCPQCSPQVELRAAAATEAQIG